MSRAKQKPLPRPARRDLVVLAADKDTAQSVEGILHRHPSLQIRAITFDIITHPQHDPGCLGQSAALLAVYQNSHSRALVVFDREGCGQDEASREDLEIQVEEHLSITGWQDRSAVIVIDPELENWIWSRSHHVSHALGWQDTAMDVRQWLLEKNFLTNDTQPKPDRPKEAMEAVLRHVRKARSSAIYRAIANSVSLTRCDDPSFVKFRQTLQEWFSA